MNTPGHASNILTFATLLFILGCASTGTIHEAEVQTEYDSIEGITYWTHTPILVQNYGLTSAAVVNMQAVGVCEGEHLDTPCEDPRWGLVFYVQGESLTDNINLTLRLGDRRIRPGSENYDADTGSLTRFSEQMAYLVNREDIQDLAELPEGEVEGRLASNELNLSYERRKAVRLLYREFSGE